MIVNRKILREKTSLSEQQIGSLLTLAWKYQSVCNYHNITALDSRGYIAPMACFDAKMLYEFFERRVIVNHRRITMEASRDRVKKICEELGC